jgi:hypothetical protein
VKGISHAPAGTALCTRNALVCARSEGCAGPVRWPLSISLHCVLSQKPGTGPGSFLRAGGSGMHSQGDVLLPRRHVVRLPGCDRVMSLSFS